GAADPEVLRRLLVAQLREEAGLPALDVGGPAPVAREQLGQVVGHAPRTATLSPRAAHARTRSAEAADQKTPIVSCSPFDVVISTSASDASTSTCATWLNRTTPIS